MTFVAGAVIWSAYLLGWFGWEALTDRVPPGDPDTFWWPSIRDLVSPGRQAYAVPQKLGGVQFRAGVTAQDLQAAQTSNSAFQDLFPAPKPGTASSPP